MAIPIKKFGQYVKLQIHSEDGQLVFETDSLKIDFDVRNKAGWERGKFTLTNLNPETIKKISDASNANYITIWTSLHDSKLSLLVDSMYISNALEEINVPDSIFSMYCYSKTRKEYLEEQVDVIVYKPSLEEMVTKVLEDAGYPLKPTFIFFPEERLTGLPIVPIRILQGSLLSVLEVLGKEYGFNFYTEGKQLIFMYKPSAKDVNLTTLFSGGADITLSTDNMRSNPKIGPATLSVVSNLEPLIKPSSVLDISNLLTIGTDIPEETLKITEEYLKDKVAGFSIYQVLSTQHKGSNWSGDWTTQTVAYSPTKGTTMSSSNWWA